MKAIKILGFQSFWHDFIPPPQTGLFVVSFTTSFIYHASFMPWISSLTSEVTKLMTCRLMTCRRLRFRFLKLKCPILTSGMNFHASITYLTGSHILTGYPMTSGLAFRLSHSVIHTVRDWKHLFRHKS